MKRQLSLLAVAALVATVAGRSAAAPEVTSAGLSNVSSLALSSPVKSHRKIDDALAGVTGPIDVVLQLAAEPLVVANGAEAKQGKARLSASQQRAHSAQVRRGQDAVVSRLLAMGGREIGRVRVAYNAVIVRIDAEELQSVADISEVIAIRPLQHYQLDLTETVPQIGAAPGQVNGATGDGVTVAVLDSGIDYTHRNLGGAGTDAAYAAAYGTATSDPKNTTRDGLFPTAKVVAGYDFVGEGWPNSPVVPDPDPIDLEGHGTHVADIIAGESADLSHKGVAPKAKLVAVKVCSAVATSCNGAALLQGIDFALDPNGDGSMDDAVDVINMSLGSGYGQFQDDLSLASANAVRAGVVVVASAGNSADRPFIAGSPSTQAEVLSVAQTQVASAKAYPLTINTPAAIAGVYRNTETVDWAPLNGTTTGNVVYVGRGCNADPYLSGNVSGQILLIDRGTCSISEKVARATQAGAIGTLIGLIAAGDAVTFSNGGECPTAGGACVPTMIIVQPYSVSIKAQLAVGQAVNVTLSESVFTPLISSVVGSSSRGPSYSYAAIKPEIGAPGSSVSAIAGTGTGEEAFGGTSGAAPMVSGVAALLLSKRPQLTPTQTKALLVNTAETQIYTNPSLYPGQLAPITRIGGGEVRANRAIAAQAAAWDHDTKQPTLSFGYLAVSFPRILSREVRVKNFSNKTRTFRIARSFRYADDQASGAVAISAPGSITVPGNGQASFRVFLTINPQNLNDWPWSPDGEGGASGGDGSLLQTVEYDGYITLSDASDSIHVPWQVLPKKAAELYAVGDSVRIRKSGASAVLPLLNVSPAQTGVYEAFALTGISKKIPASQLPGAGDNAAIIDLRAVGARLANIGGGQFGVQFAVSTYGTRAHPAYPAEFDIYVDSNVDGVPDFLVFNAELGSLSGSPFSTGQTLVYVANLITGAATAYFYADADLQSGNMILTAPLGALGLTPGSQFSFSVIGFDNYFTGADTDSIDGMVVTLGTPRYAVDQATGAIAPFSAGKVNVTHVPAGDAASPSQSGILLMYRDAKAGLEADAISVKK